MKATLKVLTAATLIAASSLASATTVTYTFNDNSLTTNVKNGTNGAADPNISTITAGYYDGTNAVAGGSVGYYNSFGFGIYSPTGCGTLPANTSSVHYRCVSGSTDEHFIDNNGNGAVIQKRNVVSGNEVGNWTKYADVKLDDFATFKFGTGPTTTNVTVTSVTIGLWDWYSEKVGTETYCKFGFGNQCFQTGVRDVFDNFIDISFNTGDNVGGTWITQHIDIGHNTPSQGDSFVLNNFGAYGLNDYFSLGAGFGLSGTGFKIKSLTVDDQPARLDCNAFPDLCPGTVPEPGTLSSLGLGALAMAMVGRIRRRRAA